MYSCLMHNYIRPTWAKEKCHGNKSSGSVVVQYQCTIGSDLLGKCHLIESLYTKIRNRTSERIRPQCVRETFSSCVPGRRNIAIEGLLHRWHRLSKDINFYVRPNKIMKAKKKLWIAGLCNCLPLLNAIESAKVHSFCKQFCLRILFSKTDS